MNTVKHGNTYAPPEQPQRVTCICTAVHEVFGDEIITTTESGQPTDPHIVCPECQAVIPTL